MCVSDKYKILVAKNVIHDGSRGYKVQCTCGYEDDTIHTSLRQFNKTCPKCGTTRFTRFGDSYNQRFVEPYVEVLHSDGKSFKLQRTNISYYFDDEEQNELKIKENMQRTITVNLLNGEVELLKNGKVDTNYHSNEYKLEIFFRKIDNGIAIKYMSNGNKGLENFYKFILEQLGNKDTYYSYYSNKYIYRALHKYMNNRESFEWANILSNAGFVNLDRFARSHYWGRDKVYEINKLGKTPKEILKIPKGTPKSIIATIRDNNIDRNKIGKIFNFIEKVDSNTFIACEKIAEEESSISEFMGCIDDMVDLYENHGYKNMKKLSVYLMRDVSMLQGITKPSNASNILLDYCRMSAKLNHTPEKYTRNLKKEHDITNMNYNMYKDEIKHRDFELAIKDDEYIRFVKKYKKYSIITPKDIDDLIREGDELSHCIASYVDRVINGKSKIYFLRENDKIDKSLVSIEVVGGNIRQARGFANRRVSDEEKQLIKDWAKENNLIEDYYC